jgi:tryptophan-rich sensory protein
MKKRINWKVLGVSILIVFLTGVIGSLFTSGNTSSSWYLENKPSFTPPGFVFPIAWNILYFLIALSLYFSWNLAGKKEKKQIMLAFGINLVANALWSYLFFEIKNPLVAFVDLLVILGTTIWMIFIAGKIDKKAGWLLVPYLLWLIFASILNFSFII